MSCNDPWTIPERNTYYLHQATVRQRQHVQCRMSLRRIERLGQIERDVDASRIVFPHQLQTQSDQGEVSSKEVVPRKQPDFYTGCRVSGLATALGVRGVCLQAQQDVLELAAGLVGESPVRGGAVFRRSRVHCDFCGARSGTSSNS